MPSVDVLNLSHEKTRTLELDDRFFGVPLRPDLLHEAVQMQRANARQGTASTKTRGEVRGGGKKPWRQKGTGRARAGSSRSPLWRGGGTVFGPKPRSYALDFPRKKSRYALYAALTSKVEEGELKVVEGFSPAGGKTQALAKILSGLKLKGKTLIAIQNPTPDLLRSARNLPHVTVRDLWALNPYEILMNNHVLIPPGDLEALQEKFSSRIEGQGAAGALR